MPVVALLGLFACTVTDAPDNLEALMVYGFVNYDDESGRYLEDTQAQLMALVETQQEELEKGYRINNLTQADLEAAGVADPQDLTGILGFMGIVDYTHTLAEVLESNCAPNKDERWPDTFVSFDVEQTTDRPCFLSEGCERLDQTIHEVASVTLLGEADRTYDASFRWVNGDDLPQAAFLRQLTPDGIEFSSDIAATHQQYSLAVVYDFEGHARRLEAFWVDFEILGADVPDDFAITTAINTMNNQAENIDTWIDENR
jgi:hypothetical protein